MGLLSQFSAAPISAARQSYARGNFCPWDYFRLSASTSARSWVLPVASLFLMR